MNLFGGFAPGSQTAEQLSRSLGSRTVMSGSISRGKNDPSQSLQMMERPLMSPDELKSMPKGSFIVMKTGVHPMRVQLRLFLDWGIRFREPYQVPERAQREVAYAGFHHDEAAFRQIRIRSKFPRRSRLSGRTAYRVRGGTKWDTLIRSTLPA